MPERSQRRQPSERPANQPQTLSLPIIPGRARQAEPPPSQEQGVSLNRSGKRAPTPRSGGLFPTPADLDPHYDDTADDDSDLGAYSRSYDIVPVPMTQPPALVPPDTREMMAMTARSHSLPTVRTAGGAIAPILPRPKRAAPPPRSIKRGLIWQIALLVVMMITFITTLHTVGNDPNARANAFQGNAGAVKDERIVNRVPTFIQIDPTIGYLSDSQYQAYSGADCSAAATSEVLTAWGDPTGNIGHVIQDMGSDLSPSGGLASRDAFQRVADAEHFNLTMTDGISAAQLANIVSNLGIPVVIGVRDDSGGYYRYFAPGHFLVVTGADANGFNIVDSSTYFVHYLPTATFMQLWDHPRAVILTPKDYTFVMP